MMKNSKRMVPSPRFAYLWELDDDMRLVFPICLYGIDGSIIDSFSETRCMKFIVINAPFLLQTLEIECLYGADHLAVYCSYDLYSSHLHCG